MSVIVNEMPDNCLECPLSYWDYYFSDLPLRCPLMSDKAEVNKNKRHEDCPLKSIRGLIKKFNMVNGCGDFIATQDVIDIIKEYCGMEDAE